MAFFSLSNTYDTTWRHYILSYLHVSGIRSILAHFFANFLQDCSFTIDLREAWLKSFIQYGGAPIPECSQPQGSIVNTTLFCVAINDLTKHVSSPVYALYVNDCHLYSQLIRTGVYTHSSAHSRILSHTGLLCVSFETAAMAFTRCHIRTFSCPSRTFHINIKKLDSIRQTSSSSHWGVSIYYLDILISRNEVFSPIIETGWLRPTLLHTRRMYQIKTVAPLK